VHEPRASSASVGGIGAHVEVSRNLHSYGARGSRAAEERPHGTTGRLDRQRDAEHRPHRGEHRQPDASLVHIHRARQPRVSSKARFALKAKTFSQARSVRSRYYINVAGDQLQAAILRLYTNAPL
jgi:hypothetical protein